MVKKKLKTLTDKQAITLQMLLNGDELYGLEMVNSSQGHLKRGTIYVMLNRLEDDGLVKSRLEEETNKGEQGPPRRKYRITGLGKRALAAKVEQMQSLTHFGFGEV